jgi:hypothetical protein
MNFLLDARNWPAESISFPQVLRSGSVSGETHSLDLKGQILWNKFLDRGVAIVTKAIRSLVVRDVICKDGF